MVRLFKLLFISSKINFKTLNDISITINDTIITSCKSIKCLGLIIGCNLTWEEHLSKLSKACYFRIRSFYKIQQFIPEEYRLIIANVFVMSLIKYMCSIWGDSTKKHIEIVGKIIKTMATLVSGKRKYESIAPVIINN